MKNKRLSLVLFFALVLLLIPVLAACGYEAESGDGAKHIPHDVDMKFENCWVCHTGGNFPAGAEYPYRTDHAAYPLIMCSSPACHSTTPTEPTQPTQPTEPTEPTEPTQPTEPTEPTEPTGPPTADNAPAITNHPIGPGYDGLCMICHMLGGTDPIPDDGYHPTYDASANQCYDCHKAG
ncbi:MAG: hypothetical protein JW954_02585 [Dehalococcoidaceae bacterium]|nr:hypothetical protein [Dehalococcoidaceae bacterium]